MATLPKSNHNRTHVLSVLMENRAGALSRLVGLFSARGYNIDNLNVAPTQDASVSRLTLITSGNSQTIEQIIKQMNKLFDILEVRDLADTPNIMREMMIVKVNAAEQAKAIYLMQLVRIFNAKVIDLADGCYTLQLASSPNKLTSFIDALSDFTIHDVTRTGIIATVRESAVQRARANADAAEANAPTSTDTDLVTFV